MVSETFPAWVLDVSELGLTTFLYGGDEDLWGFEVHINGAFTPDDELRIRAIIEYMKPLEARLTQLIQGTISIQKVRFDMLEP